MNFFKRIFRRNERRAVPETNCNVACPIARRLAEEFALLQELEFEREDRGDPSYGKATEARIIWRELFDLEMQEVDERIGRRSE